jgi:hypothetical protein
MAWIAGNRRGGHDERSGELRYFLLKIVAIIFMNYVLVFMGIILFFLRFTHYPNASSTVFSAGNTAISPAGCAKTEKILRQRAI